MPLKDLTGFGRGVGQLGSAATGPSGKPVVSDGAVENNAPVLSGYVRFSTIKEPFVTLEVLTSGEPTVPVADGGWDVIDRPQRVGLTAWRGSGPLRQDIPIVMDTLSRRGEDVEDAWEALEQLWRPRGGDQPPVIRVAGPVSRPDLKWVVSGLEPDQDTVKRRGKRLVRVLAVVSLLQYVTPDVADYANADAARRKALDERPNFTITKRGDTLRKVAKRELGTGRKWDEIRDLNPAFKTRPANDLLPANVQIRLPNG